MLSPGKWHEMVPKERGENLRFRRRLNAECAADPALRAAVWKVCRDDLLFWINAWVWQMNPKRTGEEVAPFVTWPFQDAAALTILAHWREQEDLLIEKSREMGASWLCLIVQDWCCRFHTWKRFLDVSHTADAVDRADDPDSLFWKLNFINEHLPTWLRAGVAKRKLGFVYSRTHSTTTGAATTDRVGVGGRARLFLDEFSKQRDDFAILGATADTGPRVFNGTHYGTGTAFFQLSQRPDLHKLVMHWSMHPEKNRGLYRVGPTGAVEVLDPTYRFPPDYEFVTDGRPTGGPFPGVRSPWYDRECVRRANSRDVAMHLDIDPQGSVSQFFDPLMVARLVEQYACEPYWRGDIAYDRDTGEPGGLVPSPDGPLRLWVHPPAGGRFEGRYAAGADVSAGTGATPSCLSVADARTGEKVAEYTNPHLDPAEFGALSVALCRLFNNALYAWETNGPGAQCGKKVVALRYTRIWFKTDEFDLKRTVSEKPGWHPLPNAKRVLLEDYRAALVRGDFVNRSERALKEVLAFRYGPRGDVEHANEATGAGDPAAARVNHADLAMADALACKMVAEQKLLRKAAEPAPAVVPVGSLQWRRDLAEREQAAAALWG